MKYAADAVDWDLASCRAGESTMVELFFSEELPDIARAKEICAGCVVRVECLAAAEARREPCGVWGGELFCQGKVLAFKRGRGRPPKSEQSKLTA
ncbi:MAG TPA: WhiB family transcriptional regulator [Acidimicrobiales bacterium]|nr:WhiB family transcriptional regulator [Acidimicrobiales bacterium]